MSDLGKLIFLVCSALLFIFAATTSVFLYSTLDKHLELSTGLANVYDRVEGEAITPPPKREITWAEFYITVTNMEQMNVSKLIVGITASNQIIFEKNDNSDVISNKIKNVQSKFSTISNCKILETDENGYKIVNYY